MNIHNSVINSYNVDDTKDIRWLNVILDYKEHKKLQNIMFINLATSGLPEKPCYGYYDYKNIDRYKTSRLVQLAWKIYSCDGHLIEDALYTIKPNPNNYTISIDAIKIHGITDEIAEKEGIDIDIVFNKLLNGILKVNMLVSHNLEFDYNILLSEAYRNNASMLINTIDKLKLLCTGSSTKNLLKLKSTSIYDTYKMPKLSELYKWCFNSNMTGKYNIKHNLNILVKLFFYLNDKYSLIDI